MTLQKQTITLNIAQLADQKTDPKTLTPGTPTKVENAQFLKGNRLDKRYGYDSLDMVDDSVKVFYDSYFFDPGPLEDNGRLDLVGDGISHIEWAFIFPVNTGGPFKTEVDLALNAGENLAVVDKNGSFWIVTGVGSFDSPINQSGDSETVLVEIRVDSADTVTITQDGVSRTAADMFDEFQFPNFLYLEDDLAIFNAMNPDGLQKGVGVIANPKNVIGTEAHLLLHAGDNVYSYARTEDRFRQVGKYITAETVVISPDETSRPLQACDSIHVNGVTYYALLEMLSNGNVRSAYVWVMGIDEATGEVLFTPQQATVNENSTMKLFEFNGQAYIFYSYDAGFAIVSGRKLNPEGMGDATVLFNDCAQGVSNVGANFWDVMNLNDTWMVFGYPDGPSFGDDSVRFFDGDFFQGTGNFAKKTVSSIFHGQGVALSMSSSGERFFFVGSGGGTDFLDYIIFEADGSSNGPSTTFSLQANELDNNKADGGVMTPKMFDGKHGVNILMSSDMLNFDSGFGVNRGHIAEDGTITKDVAGYKPLFDVRVISKAWIHDGKEFYVFYRNAPNDTCYFFGTVIDSLAGSLDSASIHVTSQILYGRAPDENSDYEIRFVQRNITEISPGVARYAVLAKDSIASMPGCISAKMDFNSKELFSGIPYGNSVILAGSNLSSFGGQYLRELNFWYAARAPILDRTPQDGEVTDGSHSIVVVYEFQDKNGYLHRSRPGPETTIVTSDGNAGSIQVTIPNYNNSNMDEEGRYLVKIIPYRTAGGSIYYRDDYFESWSGGDATPYIHNNLNGEITTITLKRSNTELETQAVLYTAGGEVPPTPIPPVKYISTWGSRIWAGGSARDEAIYYSKINQTNLMPEFSELFSTSIQDKPGRTTGLLGISDKIIMSKRGRLYYAFGQGPNNLGVGGSFSNFEEIPGVSGAVNGKSMVVNSAGMNYKSDKGMYSLSPGLQTQYTGAPFEDEADEDILRSVTPIDSETIRFITASGIISFNNYFKTWSKDSSSELQPIDGCIHNNQFYVLTATSLLREAFNKWTDNVTSYDMSIETGWISLAGITGFQRFYKLFMVMENFTPYTVTISLAYDYGPYLDFTTFTDNTDSRIIIYPSKQKCQAFRLKIEVATNTDTEQSLNINFVGIVAGMKIGLPKQLPVNQRIGVTPII